MRFLADENISALTVERLRAAGFEVIAVFEGERGITDPQVLKLADEENLILLTEDRDFGELVIRRQLAVRGVMITELDRLSSEKEAERVEKMIVENREKIVGHLTIIEPARVRIRPLTFPQ